MAAMNKSDGKKISASARMADLRQKSVEELRSSLAEEQEELMRARFRHAAATQENTAALKLLRRQIARISTVLQEKGQRA